MERTAKRVHMPLGLFVAIVVAVVFLPLDIAEYLRSPISGFKDSLYMLAYFLFIAAYQYVFTALIAVNRYVFMALQWILVFVAYTLLYFFLTLNITLSPTVIGLVFTNDWQTSSDFVTLPVILVLILSAIVSVVLSIVRYRYVKPLSSLRLKLVYFIMILCMLVAYLAISRIRPMLNERLPFSIYNSVDQYLTLNKWASENRDNFNDVQAVCPTDSLTVVVVIGESLRADHLSINGYERSTTPLLAQEANLVSMPHITTTAFHTAISMPRLMTRSDDDNDSIGYTEQSFITLFKNAGYHTAWVANQEPLKSFVYFTNEADTLINVYGAHSHYAYDKWLDAEIIEPLQSLLSSDAPHKLIILHTIGSHWFFNTHFDDSHEVYKPVMQSRNVQHNTKEEIINSYDNTVVYTDWFLSSVIDNLRDKRAIMIFTSDHGEGLGDDGNYLHASANLGTESPAAMIWYSDGYAAAFPEKVQSLLHNKDRRDNTGFLFHTALDAADIRTAPLTPARSLLH